MSLRRLWICFWFLIMAIQGVLIVNNYRALKEGQAATAALEAARIDAEMAALEFRNSIDEGAQLRKRDLYFLMAEQQRRLARCRNNEGAVTKEDLDLWLEYMRQTGRPVK